VDYYYALHLRYLEEKKLKRIFQLVFTLVVLWFDGLYADVLSAPDPLVVRYPLVDDEHPREFDEYFLQVLTLALERSGRPYELVPVKTPMQVEERSSLNLQKNLYDLHWLNTNSQRESQLIPVRVPLIKGLAGWRLLFIHRDSAAAFQSVSTLEDLRRFTAGQGHDWPDTAILQHNRLPMEISSDWEGLFKMLHLKRIDYFPRSVFEIWREQSLFRDFNFEIESHLVLHYPAAYYFFVGPDKPELARIVKEGLLIAVKDGSFESLFKQRFGSIIKRARLEKRTVIKLDHPTFNSTPYPNQWYAPVK
jgi:hypothetical protein